MSEVLRVPHDFGPDRIVRNVLVVGFHHKKGSMVDYAHPPLGGADGTDVPEPWRHMPSLAIPDGAHNFEWDIVYFHLPSVDEPGKTLFCISCYRQINAEVCLFAAFYASYITV
jgi:hypothetical protein